MKERFLAIILALLTLSLVAPGCGEEAEGPPLTPQGGEPMEQATVQVKGITWDEAIDHIGERGTVCGPVMGTRYASGSRGEPTFLNLGKDYPDPDRFTVVIWGENRDNFPFAPEVEYDNKTICVSGLIETYEGVPQIIADTPSDIETVE